MIHLKKKKDVMQCPKCLSKAYVRSGFTRGKQRYQCRKCKCNFTQSHKRGASLETKLHALQLYLEGVGVRAIGRIMGVHNVTVLNWVRRMGKSVKSYVQTEMPIDIRHYLARFARKTRCYSKCPTMVELSLFLLFFKNLFKCLF